MSRSIGESATLACLLEVAAPKVGNVHRGADFDDLTFYDFCVAAVAIAPHIERAGPCGVGPAVLAAIEATRRLVDSNVNLGIVLLLAPLAAVPDGRPLDEHAVGQVLEGLDARDAQCVYEAIRASGAGGLGRAARMDVADEPPRDLLAAMREAAPRDLIAQQYVDRFQLVLGELAELLQQQCQRRGLAEGIVHTQLVSLARRGDSLIARKCGAEASDEASRRARQAVEADERGDRDTYLSCLGELDFWMRSDGRRRNPGTTADLIAAALFVLLRDGRLLAD